MNTTDVDRRTARILAWIVAVSFPLATLLLALLWLNITAPEPAFREGENVLVDNIVTGFTSEQERWPQELASNLLFVLGFVAVAGLGAVLPALIGATEGARRLTGTFFVVAATLGIVGMLLYVGVKEIAADPRYCECGSRDAQLISRMSILDTISNAQNWLLDAYATLFGVGLIVAASAAAAMPSGWRAYSRWMGIAALVAVVIGRFLPFIQFEVIDNPEVDLGNVGLLLIVIVSGVLTPIWAIWTAHVIGDQEELEPTS
ncbi:MAG TPA: hypothetical protein VFW95_03885 [Candidatus Limnocylindria bacterium]|nr:hypothetical protein [Candidatus Limnocylindria bacterium]